MNNQMMSAVAVAIMLMSGTVRAQVNTGSDGSDGALYVTSSITINMADHPSGVYQYSSIYITNTGRVSFTPNPNNAPVVWLVQSNVIISAGATVYLLGATSSGGAGGAGGPGGYAGGSGISPAGQGPGGGSALAINYSGSLRTGNGSYGTPGATNSNCTEYGAPGAVYGNNYLIPLLGGSGGAGIADGCGGLGGSGGGGAILIAASTLIQMDGTISCRGGYDINSSSCSGTNYESGAGSGGAVRLVAATIAGAGGIDTSSGVICFGSNGGQGRVRFDTYQNSFSGTVTNAVFSQGSQFVLLPATGAAAQLYISSVAGQPVSSTPSGVLITPDVFISALQTNPVPVLVQCVNLPLSTPITVTMTPTSGSAVSVTVSNLSGTVSSSTATALIQMPRGGGYLSALATLGN